MTIIESILENYQSESPEVQENLVKILGHGKLGNTGRMMIYAVDQGFEHGPDRSFIMNPDAYDPYYHFDLAIEAGLSAIAAPLGFLEVGSAAYGSQIPLILKVNSANLLTKSSQGPDQALTATIDSALRLGCEGIGFTIYPGSPLLFSMIEKLKRMIQQAKAAGLVVVIWTYPRGEISKAGETGIDVVSYGVHMACLLGAHIVKTKLPTDHVEDPEVARLYQEHGTKITTLKDRVSQVVKCGFTGRRLVIFSGGATKGAESVVEDATAIRQGGGHGSIIGRNCFQRPRSEALQMMQEMLSIYLD